MMRFVARPSRTMAVMVAAVLSVACCSGLASEYRVRPFWGNAAMWGYWEFENDYVPRKDWKLTVSTEGPGEREHSSHLTDDNPETFYGPRGKESYDILIDLGKSYELGAFTVLTLNKPNGNMDSDMLKYELYVSENKENMGQPVAQGPFEGKVGKETVVTFPATKGRYVTLIGHSRPNALKEMDIRELCLVEAEAVKKHQALKQAATAEKEARWKERNSDKATETLAKEFFDMLYSTGGELNKANLRMREKLEAAGKLKAAGKHLEALRAFREYYFDKLRRPQTFGYHAADVHPYGRGAAGATDFPVSPLDKGLDGEGLLKQVEVADGLMKGDMKIGNKVVHIAEPGSVDWDAPGQPYGYTAPGGAMEPYRELYQGSGFLPLFAAFWATKKEEYLKRWADYMDDWAMNARYLHELHPIINHDLGRYPDVTTIRLFAGAALALPVGSDVIPPQAFARTMRKLATESVLNDIVYYRSGQMGWVPGAGRMLFPMLIDEFKVAPLYFREARRRNIEDLNTVQTMRDGTEPHLWPGYNWLGLINMGVLRLMDARENLPPWAQPTWEKDLHTPEWQKEFIENLAPRARYQLHWVTPGGEYPLVTHHEPPTLKGKMREAYRMMPEALNDEPTAKIYSTLYGDGLLGKPDWTSEWFPYGGYNIARTGWGPEEGYGALFCSPHPGIGSVGANCKNNGFALNAYGVDLLGDDTIHGFIGFHATSPINVDKKRQCHSYNVHVQSEWPSAHKGEMVTGWSEPSPWRWHSSDNFNVMEGVYSGAYANDNRNRTEFLDDVSHQRVALFARHAGLWIVTDRIGTAKKHAYEQNWWFPVRKNELGGFKSADIVTDDAAKTIKTKRTHTDKYWSWDKMRNVLIPNANLSMYQFTDATLKYFSEFKKDDSEMYYWQRAGATWEGEGAQQIVTALFPRKPTVAGGDARATDSKQPDGTENDLTRIEPVMVGKVNGFEAVTPAGDRVGYFAAGSQGEVLGSEHLNAVAEALLLTTNPAEKDVLRGLVLGCKVLTVEGKAVEIGCPDFEFTITPDTSVKTEPIYRPISPVGILPGADVFTEEVEVTLKSDTPNVVCTYTLDGTEPTPQSTLYKGPFKIARSVGVKARAYRPGVERNPPHTSGTHATPTSYALFTKKLPCPAEQLPPRVQGLNYEYYEDFWKEMWLSLTGEPTRATDRLQPKEKGTVDELFDLSQIPADNKPVGEKRVPCEKPYAFKYSGYLKVPEDGVYTIHAPREFVYNDTMAGYELQVYLGHAMYIDAGQPRRDGDISYWYPATRLHGLGTWSVALKKGFHEFRIVYIDFRMDGPKRLNKPAPIREYVWSGEKPALTISGPGIEKQAIPAAWLWR
ncbi:MAG: chitobiase/beta-hexosaminidase C-terminal domain-containing protein [Planctomycetota bacterium]|nr:chitobiase/beta-hexosaminidase C-terminal domain-containing protein [Planctomycetota bacterium]